MSDDDYTIKEPSDRVKVFLAAIKGSDKEEFCRPPGLGGIYKVKWVTMGLDTGAIVIHRSGQGFAATFPFDHGKSRPCRCPNCTWHKCMNDADFHGDPTAKQLELPPTLFGFGAH